MVRETLEKMNRKTLVTSQALYNIFPIMKITRQGARCIGSNCREEDIKSYPLYSSSVPSVVCAKYYVNSSASVFSMVLLSVLPS